MTTQTEQVLLVKIDQVVGYLYLPPTSTKKAIIMAQGGPSLGDNGHSWLWPISKKHNYALFIPDYIGHCHSDGKFNFKNCVETLTESEKFLTGQITGLNIYTADKIKLNFTNLLLVGDSWGGAIVPFLEKYQKSKIKNIALIKPLTDWTTQGKTKHPEEDVNENDYALKTGLKNIYRGYQDSEWPEIFQGKLKEYNPIDNLNLLQNKNVYLYHGKEDLSIHWSKSLDFYKKLKTTYPKMFIQAKFLKGVHDILFTMKALEMILKNLAKN